jgi:hypothetical protein
MFFLLYSLILDPLSHFLSTTDLNIVDRARDVIANSVMAEIAQEDPQGADEYKNSVRHHIVGFFQRIRVSLLVLDTLLAAYNAAK